MTHRGQDKANDSVFIKGVLPRVCMSMRARMMPAQE